MVNIMLGLKRDYKGVEIIALTGDISEQETDAVVNPANTWMIMGGGAAGAIKRAGGQEIEDEAVKHAPVPIGKAIVTGGGKLKAKYVIHAPTMKRPAMHINTENVRLAVKAALELADKKGFRSLAFPGMGTGVGGVGLEEAAEAMVEETKKHLDKGTSLKRIVFVGFREDLTRAFSGAISKTLAS